MFSLQFRMWLLLTVLFGFIYAAVVVIGTKFMHLGNFYFYLGNFFGMMLVQYFIAPRS